MSGGKVTEVSCPECGGIFDVRAVRQSLPRSPKQHKAFFAMVRMAVENWREDHPFQVSGATQRAREEHMRAYLLVQASHKFTLGEPLDRARVMSWDLVKRWAATAVQPDAQHPYRFLVERNGALVVDVPKSIDWFSLSHEEFKPVFDEVLFIIERETGLEVKFIKKELQIP